MYSDSILCSECFVTSYVFKLANQTHETSQVLEKPDIHRSMEMLSIFDK